MGKKCSTYPPLRAKSNAMHESTNGHATLAEKYWATGRISAVQYATEP